MSFSLLFFLLFLLQFFYFPMGMSFFEGAKVYAAEVAIFFLLILQFLSKDGITLVTYRKSFVWGTSILFAVTLYHLLFHESPTLLFGNVFRQQGTILLWVLMIFALVSSRISIEQKIKPLFITTIVFMQLVCTLLVIGAGADRPIGTLGEPNALAASVIFLWPFLIFPWPKKLPMQLLSGIGLVFAFTILFVSGSRSGLIALAVQVVFLISSRFFLRRQVIGLILALILLIGSLLLPFATQRNQYEDRGEIWISAVTAGIEHPILGVGLGNAEYELHKANVKLHNNLQGYYVDSAHNIFLDWFIQAGLVGLGVLIFFSYQSFKTFISKKQPRNSILLLGLIAALSFNPASIVTLIALWWLIGQGNKTVH